MATYNMPDVYLGDVVIWRHTVGATHPAPAIVTRVGKGAISVWILPTESRGGIPRDGVRHETDPELSRLQGDEGVWSYTQRHQFWQSTWLALVEKLDQVARKIVK